MSHSNDPRALFAPYASGEISSEQLKSLEAALRDDANLRREFIEYLNIDSALGDLAALSEAEAAEVDQAPTKVAASPSVGAGTSRQWKHTFRIATITGGVAVSLLVAAILWVVYSGEENGTSVATLVSEVNAALLWRGEAWAESDLPSGEYQLSQGLLHLRFDGGVMVYVEAPARFDAQSGQRLVLHSGRLSANVPPEGVGFIVQTPEAEIVDFGTEFSVDVAAGASEVHVFDGLVRVQPRLLKDGKTVQAIDLRTSQAIKIEGEMEQPREIELAADRFIRTFDEPKRGYPRTIKKLSPVAYYRMPIRDKGLVSEPPQCSGIVLTGDGMRPPHARGVFTGGSLRVQADSIGRGGRVDTPPPLLTGQFALATFVYLEAPSSDGTVATNMQGDEGNFALGLVGNGMLRARIRTDEDEIQSVAGDRPVPHRTWLHVVVTLDDERLKLYEDGQLVASTPCSMLAPVDDGSLWFGTNADGLQLWNGRLDELALFDKPLSEEDVANLFQAALEEMKRAK